MAETTKFGLETPRLQLRALTIADAEGLFQYRSLPEVRCFQGWAPETVEEAFRFVVEDICHIMNQPDTWFQCGIFLRGNEVLVGDLGMHFLDGTISSGGNATVEPAGVVEIGITLAPQFQGNGFAAEAVRAALDFIFGTLQKQRVIASVDPENKKSMALMQRVGFHLEGVYKNSFLFHGRMVDDAIFSVTHQKWGSSLNPTL